MVNASALKTGLAAAWLAVCLAATPGAAQTSTPPPAPTPGEAVPAPDAPAAPDAAQAAAPSEAYSYKPDGRRDPFISLIARGVEPPAGAGAAIGVGGLTTSELSVSGVLQLRGAVVAMVHGADAKTFIAHVNDRLLDGVITQITQRGLVILQEVNDPLSLVKQREVRKDLRSLEEAQ